MCGRITLATRLDVLLEVFRLAEAPERLEPRWNVAPGTEVAAVPADGRRALCFLRWGFVPHWSKDPATGPRPINARAETAARKPLFREALRARRCLVLADGFYEWRKDQDGGKTPVHIRLRGGRPFALAGLWDLWRGPDGRELRTCAILTTRANETLRPIHDRMPVLLEGEGCERWLDPKPKRPDELADLFEPVPGEAFEYWEVSRRVNRPDQDGPELIRPAAG